MSVFGNIDSVLQFDITFPSIPCTLLSVDTIDISGEQHHDIVSCEVIFTFWYFFNLYFLYDDSIGPFHCRGMTLRRED